MRQRIDKLPVYLHDKGKFYKKKDINVTHIKSTNLKKHEQEEKKYFYGIAKKHPGILSEIEKSTADVFITKFPIDEKNKLIGQAFESTENKGGIILKTLDDKHRGARIFFHEAKHNERAFKEGEKHYENIEDEKSLSTWDKPSEIEAEEYAFQKAAEIKGEEVAKKYYTEGLAKYTMGKLTDEELDKLHKKYSQDIKKEKEERTSESIITDTGESIKKKK